MEEELKLFEGVVANPYNAISDWKKAHPERKVIGLFPMHLPQELVYACGIVPVTLWESHAQFTVADSHYPPYNCAIARSVIDDTIKGRLSFLDGMLFYDTCQQAKGLPFIIKQNAPPLEFLETTYLPAILDPKNAGPSKRYLLASLDRLKQKLEKFSGRKITEKDIKRSIQVYNKNRKLLRQIYEIRRRSPGLLNSRQVLAIVWSSMLMDKMEHNILAEKLLNQLIEREKGMTVQQNGKPKVVISGHLCFAPKSAILDLIEGMGVQVVDDDLITGWRYIANDCSTNGNPLASMADRYLLREPPCLSQVDWETHPADFIAKKVRQSGADGVIQLLVKFCPPHLCVYPDIKHRLIEYGIPELLVETEHEIIGLEQAKTKLQAFIETLSHKGN